MNPNTDYVYNSIRESLKFVETKHAGLLVVNSGLLFGIFTIYKEVNMLNNWLIILPAIPFIISIALSLYAFYPRFKRKKSKKPDINLFFAEGVAQQTPDKLKELISATIQLRIILLPGYIQQQKLPLKNIVCFAKLF
ncbi:MAG: hypothetical protein N4A72_17760 [Bacteroidales bacterium]|jgi:hypothetical protein|nr:hypothetical protein [Bacteroidales bacterium]